MYARPGDVLGGKYRVDKVLGVGGMGMVVAATHLELDQRVALKFMLPEAMRSPQSVERFLREAKAVVKLRGEHICRVYDVGRLEGGAPYIVMELMDGRDLSDVLAQRGTLSVPETVDYVVQALEGVAEAHANGIVHRDLKPANLFVTTDNDGSALVKVLDFGISKSTVAGQATKTGEIMGSPAYMAPEQMASSKHVDVRADIWALGVIMYQAVTGTLPFEGETLPALCLAVMNQSPRSPCELRTEVPSAFSSKVMRCLEKDIGARFSDVGALAAALAPFGGADAASAASRISHVLTRRNAPPNASPPVVSGAAADAATILGTPRHSSPLQGPVSTRIGQVTTLQASAAAVESSPEVTRKGRLSKWVLAASVPVLALVALLATHVNKHGNATTTPAAAPQPDARTDDDRPAVPRRHAAEITPPQDAAIHIADALESQPTAVQDSRVSPIATPAPATNSPPARPRAHSTTTAKPTASSSCDPPYTIGSNGRRDYKLECLK